MIIPCLAWLVERRRPERPLAGVRIRGSKSLFCCHCSRPPRPPGHPLRAPLYTDTIPNLAALPLDLLKQVISEVEENIATTQAEYLANAQVRADEGFDSLTQAAGHATDALEVFHAYGYYN